MNEKISSDVRRVSLRFGISTAFVIIILITSAVLCVIIFIQIHDIMRHDIKRRIGDIAGLASLTINGDQHRKVKGTEDEKNKDYLELKLGLQRVKEKAPDLRFAYTIKRDSSDRYFFWIDAETDPTIGTRVGDVVELVTPLMREAFINPKMTMVEPQFYTDSWGTWLSAYSPVYASDGTLECLVGVDISAARIKKAENKAIIILTGVALIITIPVAMLGLYISTRIVRPLSQLEKSMMFTRELQLDHNVELESRFVEIISMRDTLNAMKSGLRSFSKYVPTEIVRELIRDGSEASLGGRKAGLTIFFSDIEGFTELSEKSTPESLAADLAEYFAIITGTILDSGGTVDKYIGDAVMAFWGAPVSRGDHALSALKASMVLYGKLKELNIRREVAGRPTIKTRIGLASGEVIVGNFGYEKRLNYTVMGDTVNLASRLEGLNKYLGTSILANEEAVKLAGSAVTARLLGTVAVKGKNEGVRVYQPLGFSEGKMFTPLWDQIEKWNSAMELFLAKDFSNALEQFETWLSKYPDDKPAVKMAADCRRYISNPPPPGWDGTIIMDSK